MIGREVKLMTRFKKVLSLAIAAMISAAIFTGCAGDKNKVTINVFNW